MTTREINIEKVQQYINYAINTNVHVTPRKGINSGAHGNAFERLIKISLNNYRFKGTSLRGHYDSTKKINGKIRSFEIKQGAGELGVLDSNEKLIKSCLTSDYFIVCVSFIPDANPIKQSYILERDNFLKVLQDTGLIRKKKSTAMLKRPKELQYYDRLAIQSFSNSNRKTNLYYDNLEKYGQKFETWLKENNMLK